MMETPTLSSEHTPFRTPQEELAFLRRQVFEREQALEAQGQKPERRTIAGEKIGDYKLAEPEDVLASEHRISAKETEKIVLKLAPEEHDEQMSELLGLLHEKGVRNTLSVIERMNNPHITDDFHRILVQYVAESLPIAGLKEGGPLFQVLNMTLYEVSLPDVASEGREKTLKELVSSMEQFYAGMLSVADERKYKNAHFTLEIALSHSGDEVSFFASVPKPKRDLFEKQILSVFPSARIEEHKNDYNIFNEHGSSAGAYGKLATRPIFPIKTYEQFDYDPLNVLINAFSKLAHEGEGAAIQFVFHPTQDTYTKKYRTALDRLQKGDSTKEALQATETGLTKELKSVFFSGSAKKKDTTMPLTIDQVTIDVVKEKVASPIIEANLRIIASAGNQARAGEILSEITAAFNQFKHTQGNTLTFEAVTARKRTQFFREFSYREFSNVQRMPLNVRELTTMIHFPATGITSSSQLKHTKATIAPAPIDLPQEGIILGVNNYRTQETHIHMAPEDRLRHFYTIGQTGTGKSTLLKNMIIQDIVNGEGVCMIDPHGNDVIDVLSTIPPHRFSDVIYFDPSYTERPVALNMLEYDTQHPEQKTFVVNELFSIFQKLYSGTPESMGPAFEQYFRNATLLVIEDPDSGATLLDVSRVLSDERFRSMKISHCRNPVVVQFWREIAEKAGGEAALANIVPYITNKFDVFLANEIMRPIVAQEHSAFNFRDIMDKRKILLVNLAKGRLGDINANLIGLILVGKILMAALSRAAPFHGEIPPFYLYIDEFQNVTTSSITTILSEARKYGLGLHVAHQFIAQLENSIRDAVFGNVGSLCAFRVGAEDAQVLEKQFEPVFSAADLMNLDNRNAYLKLLMHGKPAKAFTIETLPPTKGTLEHVDKLKELSYRTYGRDREEVEEYIRNKYQKTG